MNLVNFVPKKVHLGANYHIKKMKQEIETLNMNLVNFVPTKSPKSCCLEIINDILKCKKNHVCLFFNTC